MTNSKQTKKALFSSVIALILCFSMLIGTTFAWFTDSVQSGLNEIKAGNLDVELEYYANNQWNPVQDATNLFGNALWEPGHTEVVYLKVSNLGSLALKYKLGITVAAETTSVTEKGEVIKLSDHIQFGIVADKKGEDAYEDRGDAIAALNGSQLPIGTSYASADTPLYPKDSTLGQPSEAYLALVVYMPETVGNEANHASGAPAPTIDLGISLYATQLVAESDSFGDDYDTQAKYDADLWDGSVTLDWYDAATGTQEDPYVLDSASDLAGLAQLVNGTAASTYSLRSTAKPITFAGKYLVLDANINLNNMNWTPIGLNADSEARFQGTFDGQGYTIFDLTVRPEPGYTAAGLFGVVNGTVKDLKIVGATIEHTVTSDNGLTDNGIAVVAGSLYPGDSETSAGTIDTVSVKNATVKGNRYVATVVGYCYGSVTNCSVENVTLVATPNLVGENEYNNGDKVGGLVGYYAASASEISGNTITNVSLKGYRDLAAVVGASYYAETVKGNTVTNAQLAVDQKTGSYGVKDANAGIVVGRLLGGTLGDNKVEGEISLTLTGELKAMTVPAEVDTLILKDLTITASEGSALTLPEGFAGKVVVEGKNTLTGATGGNGIYVPANTTLDLSGTGSLTAIGNARVDDNNGGSGIGGEGTINIHDLAELTAKGYGKAGFGIGGASASITITNTNITYACGGYVQPNFKNDTSYGKTEPEGGAAIGSSTKGAVITLNDVVIENAQGGSKAAGIGARYHTGVTINIKNSTIKNVEGGNASAGIGGSRVSDDVAPADQHVRITIENSTIKAIGGQFGAGIGSGYDTHCGEKKVNGVTVPHITETICTINIDAASNITAQGGKYAAGVGTGYHVAGLAGNIQCQVNATAGESREKYTVAQNVGFGVVDHGREVSYLTTAPSITYQGQKVTVPAVQVVVTVTSDNIDSVDFLQDNVTYKFTGSFPNDVIVQSASGLTQTFDGTDAEMGRRFELLAPGILGGYQDLTGVKTGKYTVKGFEADQVNVFAYNTSVELLDNVTNFIHICGGNIDMKLDGNTVDAEHVGHTTVTNNQSNEYGVYLYVTDYTLSFTNNTVTNSYSHAVGICGRQSEMNGFETAGANNAITEFSGNKLSITEGAKDERAVLKIWDCGKYAPKDVSGINDAAKGLIEMVKNGENTITKRTGDVNFDFYGATVSEFSI